MGMTSPFKIPEPFLSKIFAQAEREYPEECCGMILGPREKPKELSTLRPCKNVQSQMHASFPEVFPREARTAYFISPAELLKIQKETRLKNEEIRVLYHSHIDAAAYFSEEDERIALPEGEPAYPGVLYLVVSVIKGRAKEASTFRWDPLQKRFVSPSA